MVSTREQILARLMVVLAAQPATIRGDAGAFVTIARNRGEILPDKRPALILMDGDEIVPEAFTTRGPRATQLVVMSPEIIIVMDSREPANALIGEDLNANLETVSNAIAADDQLQALVGTNGNITYGGLTTDLKHNFPLQGVYAFTMLFTYARRHTPPA